MAARLRSKSESLSSPPQKASSARHSSGSRNDLIDVTFVNKSQTISPLARQLKAHADSDVNVSPEPVVSIFTELRGPHRSSVSISIMDCICIDIHLFIY